MTVTVILTDLEVQAIKGIIDSDYRDGDHPVDRWVWSWSCNPFGEGQRKKFSGVVSSLSKKGLVVADGASGDEACLKLTAAGLEVYERCSGKPWNSEAA